MMNSENLPDIIYQSVAKNSFSALAPAWVQLISGTDTIAEVGGAWENYSIDMPQIGSGASNLFDILVGLFPIDSSFELPQVELQDNHYTNISGIHEKEQDWLLFCDVTQNTLQLQTYQQASNELSLVKAKLNQTLKRYVGLEVSERIHRGDIQLDLAGERKHITTLFVDIRGFTPFNETHDAQVVMQTLNDYMDCMLSPILDEQGMVDKIMGDGVMAVFGVLPSEKKSTLDALNAAKQMIHGVLKLNEKRKETGLPQLGIGVGIASGEAVLGILGSHERRAFTAIGRHVNFAARLESNARVGEVLIDEATYKSLNQPVGFSPVTIALKGIGQSDVYSQTLDCVHINH